MDFSKPPSFYDTFALRDAEGYEAVTPTFPYFRAKAPRNAMMSDKAVPVRSCWNGIGKLNLCHDTSYDLSRYCV